MVHPVAEEGARPRRRWNVWLLLRWLMLLPKADVVAHKTGRVDDGATPIDPGNQGAGPTGKVEALLVECSTALDPGGCPAAGWTAAWLRQDHGDHGKVERRRGHPAVVVADSSHVASEVKCIWSHYSFPRGRKAKGPTIRRCLECTDKNNP